MVDIISITNEILQICSKDKLLISVDLNTIIKDYISTENIYTLPNRRYLLQLISDESYEIYSGNWLIIDLNRLDTYLLTKQGEYYTLLNIPDIINTEGEILTYVSALIVAHHSFNTGKFVIQIWDQRPWITSYNYDKSKVTAYHMELNNEWPPTYKLQELYVPEIKYAPELMRGEDPSVFMHWIIPSVEEYNIDDIILSMQQFKEIEYEDEMSEANNDEMNETNNEIDDEYIRWYDNYKGKILLDNKDRIIANMGDNLIFESNDILYINNTKLIGKLLNIINRTLITINDNKVIYYDIDNNVYEEYTINKDINLKHIYVTLYTIVMCLVESINVIPLLPYSEYSINIDSNTKFNTIAIDDSEMVNNFKKDIIENCDVLPNTLCNVLLSYI